MPIYFEVGNVSIQQQRRENKLLYIRDIRVNMLWKMKEVLCAHRLQVAVSHSYVLSNLLELCYFFIACCTLQHFRFSQLFQ